jgi:hypothetical protein
LAAQQPVQATQANAQGGFLGTEEQINPLEFQTEQQQLAFERKQRLQEYNFNLQQRNQKLALEENAAK